LKNNTKKKLTDVAQDAPKTIFLAGDEAGLYLQATTCHVGLQLDKHRLYEQILKSQNEFLWSFELAKRTRSCHAL